MEGVLDKNKIIEGGMMGEGGIETNNNSATPKGRTEPTRATSSGNIITKPTSYDVLFGRGKPYQVCYFDDSVIWMLILPRTHSDLSYILPGPHREYSPP